LLSLYFPKCVKYNDIVLGAPAAKFILKLHFPAETAVNPSEQSDRLDGQALMIEGSSGKSYPYTVISLVPEKDA
jgi:hypothetical protein